MGADLDGPHRALIMRATDDVSGEAVQPHAPPPGVMVTDLSNRSAITAFVLGITSVVLLPAFAIGLWASLDEVELDAWVVILFLISLVAAICAGLFGMQGGGSRKSERRPSPARQASRGAADLLIFLEEWEWARQRMIEELSRA